MCDCPNYILRFDEAMWPASFGKKCKNHKIKLFVLIIVAIIVVASIIFQESIFNELPWSVRCLLVCLVLRYCLFSSGPKIPMPVELRFYDDCLMVYRDKHMYFDSSSRREYDVFKYSEIKEVVFRQNIKRLNIIGIVERTWYDYKKDGALPPMPTYHKTVDSIVYFYTNFATDIDVVREIETHSPLMVRMQQY